MRSKSECISSLREAKKELGESPSKRQYERLGLEPASSTISRKFGSWDKAKDEAGLKTISQGERNSTDVQPKPDDIELNDDEEWEKLTPQQRSYRKNKDEWYEKEKKRKNELRVWLHRVKEELECKRCGEQHPGTLDFHHRGGEEKFMEISAMVTGKYSKERIREEMAKCVVLCSNCHRKKHYSPPTS